MRTEAQSRPPNEWLPMKKWKGKTGAFAQINVSHARCSARVEWNNVYFSSASKWRRYHSGIHHVPSHSPHFDNDHRSMYSQWQRPNEKRESCEMRCRMHHRSYVSGFNSFQGPKTEDPASASGEEIAYLCTGRVLRLQWRDTHIRYEIKIKVLRIDDGDDDDFSRRLLCYASGRNAAPEAANTMPRYVQRSSRLGRLSNGVCTKWKMHVSMQRNLRYSIFFAGNVVPYGNRHSASVVRCIVFCKSHQGFSPLNRIAFHIASKHVVLVESQFTTKPRSANGRRAIASLE